MVTERAPRPVLLIGGLGLLALIWGTQFLVIKIGQRTLPPLLTVSLRFAILFAVAQVAVFVTRSRAPAGTLGKRLSYGLAQAVCMGLLYWSEERIATAIAGVVLATTPFFVVLLARAFVREEESDKKTVVAIVLGFAGVAMVTLGTAHGSVEASLVGVLAVLGAALAGAVNKVLSKALTSTGPAPVLLRDLGALVAMSSAVASIAVERGGQVEFTTQSIVAFAYLGLVASAGASGLYLVILRHYRITALAYLQFVTALIAVLTGVLLGGERLGAEAIVGVVLILAGLAVMASRLRQN